MPTHRSVIRAVILTCACTGWASFAAWAREPLPSGVRALDQGELKQAYHEVKDSFLKAQASSRQDSLELAGAAAVGASVFLGGEQVMGHYTREVIQESEGKIQEARKVIELAEKNPSRLEFPAARAALAQAESDLSAETAKNIVRLKSLRGNGCLRGIAYVGYALAAFEFFQALRTEKGSLPLRTEKALAEVLATSLTAFVGGESAPTRDEEYTPGYRYARDFTLMFEEVPDDEAIDLIQRNSAVRGQFLAASSQLRGASNAMCLSEPVPPEARSSAGRVPKPELDCSAQPASSEVRAGSASGF